MPSISPENNKKCDDGPDYKQQAKTLIITGVTPSNSSSAVDSNSGEDQHNENQHYHPPLEEDGPDFKQQAKSILVAGQRSAKLNACSCSNRLGKPDAPGSKEVSQESDSPEALFNNFNTNTNTIGNFHNETNPNTYDPIVEEGNVPIVEARLMRIEELGEQTRAQIYMQPWQPQTILYPEGLRMNEAPNAEYNQQGESHMKSTTAVESSPQSLQENPNKSILCVITKKKLIWIIVILGLITIVAAIGGICANGSCTASSNDVDASDNSNNGVDGFEDTTTTANPSSTSTAPTRATALRPSSPPTGESTDVFDYNECMNACYEDFYDEYDTYEFYNEYDTYKETPCSLDCRIEHSFDIFG